MSKYETVFHLSHIDNDGYGCQMLTTLSHPNVKMYNVNYGDINKAIEEIAIDIKKEDGKVLFLITDLNLTDVDAKAVDKLKGGLVDVFLFDHHVDKFNNSDHYDWYYLDTTKSATMIVYDWLVSHGKAYGFNLPNLKYLKEYVRAINAADIFLESDPLFKLGRTLASITERLMVMLPNALYNKNAICLETIINGRYALEEMSDFMDNEEYSQVRVRLDNISIPLIKVAMISELVSETKGADYYNNNYTLADLVVELLTEHLLRNRYDNTYYITVNDVIGKCIIVDKIPFLSDVAKSFLNRCDYDFVMIAGTDGSGKFSLRSKGFDVNAVASLFGGGGHIQASGMKLNDWDPTLSIPRQIENYGFRKDKDG